MIFGARIFVAHIWAWHYVGAKGSGTTKTPKNLAYWGSLPAPSLSRNQVFQNIWGKPPIKPFINCLISEITEQPVSTVGFTGDRLSLTCRATVSELITMLWQDSDYKTYQSSLISEPVFTFLYNIRTVILTVLSI